MKKFDRLPPEQRKEEIQEAALRLFLQKGFAATTMENIIQQVTLSKGGVYRIYSSTGAILQDLMLKGMTLRNAFYARRAEEAMGEGKSLTLEFLVDMVADSLLLYPEFSRVYTEFLWEKRRDPELQALYEQICETTVRETETLISRFGADGVLAREHISLKLLTELMNSAVLSLHTLGLDRYFTAHKEDISKAILLLLKAGE